MTDEAQAETPTSIPDDSGEGPLDIPSLDDLPQDLTPSTEIREGGLGNVETKSLDTTNTENPEQQ